MAAGKGAAAKALARRKRLEALQLREEPWWHGGFSDFQEFNPKKSGTSGFNFSKERKFAEGYAADKSAAAELDADIIVRPFHIPQNMFDFNNDEHIKKLADVLPDEISIQGRYGLSAWGEPAKYNKEDLIKQIRGIQKPYTGLDSQAIESIKRGENFSKEGSKYSVISFDGKTVEYAPIHSVSALKNAEKTVQQLKRMKGDGFAEDWQITQAEMELERLQDSFRSHKIDIDPEESLGFDNWDILESPEMAPYLQEAGFEGAFMQEKGNPTATVFDASRIRLAPDVERGIDGADLDPAKASSRNIMAGMGGLGTAAVVGAPLMGYSQDADAGWITKGGRNVLEAYHGSPHDFDKFSVGAIGTGEGAQAYGHGLYFADAEDVAEAYRGNLSEIKDKWILRDSEGKEVEPKDEIEYLAQKYINDPEDLEAAVEDIPADHPNKQLYKDALARLGKWKDEGVTHEFGGSLYKTHIDVQPDDLLDWDKPLSEQPKKVLEALAFDRDSFKEWVKSEGKELDSLEDWQKEMWAGSYVHDKGFTEANEKYIRQMVLIGDREIPKVTGGWAAPRSEEGMQRLNQMGIKGIQYDDAMSRGKEGGTKNYVIFDDEIIQIAEKNGVPFEAVESVAINQGISKQAALNMLIGGGTVGTAAMTPRQSLAYDALSMENMLDAELEADAARIRQMREQRIEAPQLPALAAFTDFVKGIPGADFTGAGTYANALDYAAWGTGDMGDVANEMGWVAADIDPSGAVAAGMIAKELSQPEYDRLMMEAEMHRSFGDERSALLAEEAAYQTRLTAPINAAKQFGSYLGGVRDQFVENLDISPPVQQDPVYPGYYGEYYEEEWPLVPLQGEVKLGKY